VGGKYAVDYAAALPVFTVRQVVVEGTHYIDRNKIVASTGIKPGCGLFEVNLVAVAIKLKKEYAARDFTVFRRLPDTIIIRVQERKPMDLLGTVMVIGVDEVGFPLSHVGQEMVSTLPIVSGIKSTASLSDSQVKSRLVTGLKLLDAISKDSPEIMKRISDINVSTMGINLLDNGLEVKRVAGGLLVQKRFDSKIVSPESVDVVSARKPSPEEVRAALFNWTVACFTRSNAIVIGTSDKTHGIGSGQRSRIDSAEDAIRLSSRGYGPQGCVLASDAFMPFPDVVELAGKHGIKAIIYPLGSVKDQEVIDKANELGLAMIVTRRPGEVDSERCFLHR
jgi:phosphoribosylaminoimidazolecarboxamide formyltransferase/IMP cyclohydrolase